MTGRGPSYFKGNLLYSKSTNLIVNLIQKHPHRKYPEQYLMKKPGAPHSNSLAWKIPWMEEPGRLQSMGSLRVGHN